MSITVNSGELCAMIFSTTLMLALFATVWDSGWYCSALLFYNASNTSATLRIHTTFMNGALPV